jgi:hypothetical protein
VSTDALMPFVDETATNSGMRFYRVVSP